MTRAGFFAPLADDAPCGSAARLRATAAAGCLPAALAVRGEGPCGLRGFGVRRAEDMSRVLRKEAGYSGR